MNRRQAARLAELSDWLAPRETKFLFELIVPPSVQWRAESEPESFATELAAARGRHRRAPGGGRRARRVEGGGHGHRRRLPAAWPTPPGPAGAIESGASSSARAPTRRRWRTGCARPRGVDGFIGFAIGRTIFWEPLSRWIAGTVDADTAAAMIADNYRRTIDVYTSATRRSPPDAGSTTPGSELARPRLAPPLARARDGAAARVRPRVAGRPGLRLARRRRRAGPGPSGAALDHEPHDARLRPRRSAGSPRLRPARRPRPAGDPRRLRGPRARRLVRGGPGRRVPGRRKEAYAHSFVLLAAASGAIAGREPAAALLDEAVAVVTRRFWSDDERAGLEGWDRRWETDRALPRREREHAHGRGVPRRGRRDRRSRLVRARRCGSPSG